MVLVSRNSALIRKYKFTGLKQCDVNFTYADEFEWKMDLKCPDEQCRLTPLVMYVVMRSSDDVISSRFGKKIAFMLESEQLS